MIETELAAQAAEQIIENTALQSVAAAGGMKLAPLMIPALGVFSLVGIIAWQFWKANKDEEAMKAAKA